MSIDPPPLGLSGPADDSRLREDMLSASQVYRGDLLDVRRDCVVLPDGRSASREYIVHPGAVMVVPMLGDGRLLVERQWRYPLARVMLEFPAGKVEPGESALRCAVRELVEETGYRAGEWARAGLLHNAIAYSTEGIEVWFARGLVAGERRLDVGEFVELGSAGADELHELTRRGELTDAKTLIGLSWLSAWRAGQWPVEWRPAP